MMIIIMGHDKMRSGANLRGASPLVRFNHVIDPHFVAFSSSLYTTNCNPKPNLNPTVITDPQMGPRDPQIVTFQIRPAPHFVVCRLICCWRSQQCIVYIKFEKSRYAVVRGTPTGKLRSIDPPQLPCGCALLLFSSLAIDAMK